MRPRTLAPDLADSFRYLLARQLRPEAEIDAWESRLEALSKAMPAGEAARLVAAMEAISESTAGIWQLEPALSNPAGE